MDSGIYAILTTFGFDLVIFLGCFFMFVFYRKFRSMHVQIDDPTYTPKNAVLSESDTDFKTIIRRVWNTSLSEIFTLCGLEAYIFLAVHIQIIVGLGIMTVLGFSVLIPIYVQGNGDIKNQLESTGISNVLHDNHYLIASAVFFGVFSGLGYFMVYIIIKLISKKSLDNNIPLETYAVEIRGIPRNLKPEESTALLKNKLQSEFGEDVLEVYVVPDFTKSYIAHKKSGEYRMKLQHFREYYETHNRRPYASETRFGKQEDAIELYSRLLEEEANKFEECLNEGNEFNTGYAYVICVTPLAAQRVRKNFKRRKDELNSILWDVHRAPSPNSIKWENLNVNHLVIRGKRLCILGLFIVVFFFLMTPSQFMFYVGEFLGEIKAKDLIQGILNSYLPTLLLLIYKKVLLNNAIAYLVKQEKHVNTSDETVSKLVKLLIFVSFFVFLYQLIGIQLIEIVKSTIEGDISSWRNQLANSLTHTGQFFTVYMIHEALLYNGLEVLQIPKVVDTKLKLASAVTEKERSLAYEAESFNFGFEYASFLADLLIVITFSVTFPLILFVGSMNFVLRYYIYKHNILCVYYVDKTSKGEKIPTALVRSLLTFIFIFQFVTAGVLLLNGTATFLSVGSSFTLVSFILYLVLMVKAKPILKRVMFFLQYIGYEEDDDSTKEQPLLGHDHSYYLHPVEKLLSNS